MINLSGNEPPLGFWKLRENQYFNINHPVTTSQEKWAFKVDKIFSPKIYANRLKQRRSIR